MTQVNLWVSAAMDMLNQASVSLVMDIDEGGRHDVQMVNIGAIPGDLSLDCPNQCMVESSVIPAFYTMHTLQPLYIHTYS